MLPAWAKARHVSPLILLLGHHTLISYQTLNHQSSGSLILLGLGLGTTHYISGQCGAVDYATAARRPEEGGGGSLLCLWRGGKSLPIGRSTGRARWQGSHDRAHLAAGSHTRAHLAAGSHDVIPCPTTILG